MSHPNFNETQLKKILQNRPGLKPSEEFCNEISTLIKERKPKRANKKIFTQWKAPLALASVTLLVLLISMNLFNEHFSLLPTEEENIIQAEGYVVNKGEQGEITIINFNENTIYTAQIQDNVEVQLGEKVRMELRTEEDSNFPKFIAKTVEKTNDISLQKFITKEEASDIAKENADLNFEDVAVVEASIEGVVYTNSLNRKLFVWIVTYVEEGKSGSLAAKYYIDILSGQLQKIDFGEKYQNIIGNMDIGNEFNIYTLNLGDEEEELAEIFGEASKIEADAEKSLKTYFYDREVPGLQVYYNQEMEIERVIIDPEGFVPDEVHNVIPFGEYKVLMNWEEPDKKNEVTGENGEPLSEWVYFSENQFLRFLFSEGRAIVEIELGYRED